MVWDFHTKTFKSKKFKSRYFSTTLSSQHFSMFLDMSIPPRKPSLISLRLGFTPKLFFSILMYYFEISEETKFTGLIVGCRNLLGPCPFQYSEIFRNSRYLSTILDAHQKFSNLGISQHFSTRRAT